MLQYYNQPIKGAKLSFLWCLYFLVNASVVCGDDLFCERVPALVKRSADIVGERSIWLLVVLISIVIDYYRIVGSWIMVLGKIGAILLMVLVADLVLAASGNFTLCSSVFRWAHYYGMFVWLFTSLGGFVAIFGEFSFKLLFNYYSHCWSIIMKVKQMASVVMLRENVD